jgi:solute carrier family 25 phosphate transporter 3
MEGFWSRDNSELLSFEADWREILDPAIEPGEGDDFHLTARDLGVVVLITTGISALMATMIIMSGTGAWRYYFAGGACAAVSHTIPVPVDVVKTRKQVDADYVDCSFPDALRKLVQAEGPTSLFVGLGPTFWGYCIEGSVKFGVYEILKPLMATVIPYRLLNFAACGAVSGFAASIMLCPMEALRIRLVAEREYAERGWIQGGLWMIRREGASGFARGIWPMLYKQVPYTITKNVSFDLITTALYRRWSSTVGWVVPLTAAVVASVLSCLASQPGDMLLSLVNAHEGERRDTMDLARVLWRLKGWRGFFVGLKTRLLHVGMIVTMQLLIYDFVKRSFGIAATGSI